MPIFPSTDWFDALAAAAREDNEVLESLGFANIRLALRIEGAPDGDTVYGLRLEDYDVFSDGEVDTGDWGADCVLEGPAAVWEEMVANIVENGAADLGHTLNALSLPETPLRVVADDPMGRDLFFRYNQTLQEIFDRAARVPTEFAALT
ncbi:MAG: hypothetical protein M5U31_02505 [Acidimicrobiia bacterium]|nr:hypothetical protein [Acidimicrobiia bacterium]